MINAQRLSVVRGVVLGVIPLCLAMGGCGDSPSAPPVVPVQPVPPSQAAEQSPALGSHLPEADTVEVIQHETWDIIKVKGSRSGYTHITVSRAGYSGREAVRTEAVEVLDVQRAGERIQPGVRVVSIGTPEGQLLEFQSEMLLGAEPLKTVGRVIGDRVVIETTSQGSKTTREIPWSEEYGGPFAAEESLRRQPMQPGQTRTIRTLMPDLGQLATVTMTARDYESVELPVGTRELLRIDSELLLADGQSLAGGMWMDRQGDTLKSTLTALGMETVRATKALALQEPETLDLDLLWDVVVKVDRRLPNPHGTKRVSYRVHLDEGNPAEVFVSGSSQSVKPIDPHTAEVVVYALRPGQGEGNPDAPEDLPREEDRQPNNFIQSDYPKIVAMAGEAAGEEEDPWERAVALERYAYELMTQKDFSQALATAAEVADNPAGDCSEHAVLLAALARASGIPARVVVGLVYMAPAQSFGYHMWNEVYIDGRWIPLDATLGRGGIGAAHLKLIHASLEAESGFGALLPVIQVIGQLKIEILDVQ